MKNVMQALLQVIPQEDCVLVCAVGGEGSAPRKTQAHMVIGASGRLWGTVGGGAIEARSVEIAQDCLMRRASCTQAFALRQGDALQLGMICGGDVTMHFRFIAMQDQTMLALFKRAAQMNTIGEAAHLMIRLCDGALSLASQGELLGASVPSVVLDVLSEAPRQIQVDGIAYYTEPLVSAGCIYIFGGGHVAQALAPLLATLDFRYEVIEDREAFADPALFPGAHAVRLMQPEDWPAALHITEDDCVCIMTRGHENDYGCQVFALGTRAGYIGVMGSRRKIAATNARLLDAGFTQQDIARITTPIGLEIGAATPAEIAVSIAAQLIAHRAAKRGAAPKHCPA